MISNRVLFSSIIIAVLSLAVLVPVSIYASNISADDVYGMEATFGVAKIFKFTASSDTSSAVLRTGHTAIENGRGITYDGTNLWYTVLTDPGFDGDGFIHKIALTGGADIALILDPGGIGGPGIGALDFDGTDLWAIDYIRPTTGPAAGLNTIYKISTAGVVLASCTVTPAEAIGGPDTLAIVNGKILTDIGEPSNAIPLLEFNLPTSVGAGSCVATGNVYNPPVGLTGIDTDSSGNLIATDLNKIYNLGTAPYSTIVSQNTPTNWNLVEDITTLFVESLNTAPTVTTQTVNTNEDDRPVIILAGTDPESDPLSFTIESIPAIGTGNLFQTVDGTTANGPAITAGTVVAHADDKVVYIPPVDLNGSPFATFTFSASDGSLSSSAALVTINVAAVNDAPSFAAGSDVTVNEDSGAYGPTAQTSGFSPGGGADEVGQTVLNYNVANTNAALFLVAPDVDNSGKLTFTPAANANGESTVTISVQDSGGLANGGVDTSPNQTFKIIVNAVNDAPSFVKGSDVTVNEDSGAYGPTAQTSGFSPGGGADEVGQTVLNYNVANTNAALFLVAPDVDNSGKLTFTPAANANGESTVTISVQDSGGLANGGVDTSPNQTFKIIVNAVNDAPSFVKGSDVTVNEDSVAYSAAQTSAFDAGPPDEDIAQSLLDYNVANNLPAIFDVQPDVSNTGTLTFTPKANANGVATVTISVQDDGGTAFGGVDTSPNQTFKITVSPLNDNPSAVPVVIAAQISEDKLTDTDLTTLVRAGVTDVDLDTLLNFPVTDSFTIDSVGLVIDPAKGDVRIGSVLYKPNGAFESLAADETENDVFSYGAIDSVFGSTSANSTVTVTIDGQNDAPEAVDDTGETDEDTLLTVNGVLDNDKDADTSDTHKVTKVNGLAGNVGSEIVLASGATLQVDVDGSYTYDPRTSTSHQTLSEGAKTTESFTYTISDFLGSDVSGNTPAGDSDQGQVVVTINGKNDAPVSNDDNPRSAAYDSPRGVTLVVPDSDGVKINHGDGADFDVDSDAVADPSLLSFSVIGGSFVTTEIASVAFDVAGTNGGFTVVPAAGFCGDTSFNYKITDNFPADSNVSTVTVSFYCVDWASDPVAEGGTENYVVVTDAFADNNDTGGTDDVTVTLTAVSHTTPSPGTGDGTGTFTIDETGVDDLYTSAIVFSDTFATDPEGDNSVMDNPHQQRLLHVAIPPTFPQIDPVTVDYRDVSDVMSVIPGSGNNGATPTPSDPLIYDSNLYEVTDSATLRLLDTSFDSNSVIDSVTAFISTSSAPVGFTHQLIESGPNTGFFQSQTLIQLSANGPNDPINPQLLARANDDLIAIYQP